MLPGGYRYKVTAVTLFPDPANFIAVIRANITSEEGVEAWVKEFQRQTCTDLRREGGKSNTSRVKYKVFDHGFLY